MIVALDVKPGSAENPINTRSHGVIPVAILKHKQFLTRVLSLDLVLYFRTYDAGIQCGDTSVSITGETVDGIPIQRDGYDSHREL